MPCEPRHRRKEREACRAPWPPWKTRLPSSGGPSLPTARPIASIATFPAMRSDIDQPATLRGEGACHGCEIGPPFSCGHAGDAARPKPVAPAHGESALYQVQPRVSRLDLLPNAVLSGRAPSGRSELPHGAERALLAHGDAAFSQLAVDAPVAVTALVPLEGLDGEPFGRLSLYLGVGSPPAEILVETGFRDFHQPACLLDGADPAPMPFEELEPRAWSWLEKARRFFSIHYAFASDSTALNGSRAVRRRRGTFARGRCRVLRASSRSAADGMGRGIQPRRCSSR